MQNIFVNRVLVLINQQTKRNKITKLFICAAVEILEKVNSTHIKLLVDLYHLQHIKGNITNTIRDLMPLIGHIQV